MINGRIIIASVNAPDSMEYPQCSVVAKNSSPNRPYTIEGMPERVSAVIRMIPTILPVLLAYSTRKMAANTPIGTAISREITVISSVFTIAGSTELFSLLYSSAKRSGVMLPTPLIRINATKNISTAIARREAAQVAPVRTEERMLFL